MVEEAHAIATREHDKDDVPGAKLRVDTKLMIATMFNRDEFSARRGVNLTLNVGRLHLAAMLQRSLPSATVILIPEENGYGGTHYCGPHLPNPEQFQ